MSPGESVDLYYGRMEYFLQRWHNHGMPNAYLTGIFIGGLYPPEFKIAIKEKNPPDLDTALQYAKRYEEARISEDQLGITDPLGYSNQYIYPNQAVQAGMYPVPQMKSYPTPNPVVQPVVVANAKPEIKTDLENQLNKLVEGMTDLRVQITNVPTKRNKPSNIRANVWCANCKGYGHLSTECPSPIEGKDNNRPCC